MGREAEARALWSIRSTQEWTSVCGKAPRGKPPSTTRRESSFLLSRSRGSTPAARVDDFLRCDTAGCDGRWVRSRCISRCISRAWWTVLARPCAPSTRGRRERGRITQGWTPLGPMGMWIADPWSQVLREPVERCSARFFGCSFFSAFPGGRSVVELSCLGAAQARYLCAGATFGHRALFV